MTEGSGAGEGPRGTRRGVGLPAVMLVLLGTLGISLAYGMMLLMPLYVQELGGDEADFGVVFSSATVTAVLCIGLLIRYPEALRPHVVVALAVAAYGIGAAGTSLVTDGWTPLIGIGVLLGTAWAVVYAATPMVMSGMVTDQGRATYFGYLTGADALLLRRPALRGGRQGPQLPGAAEVLRPRSGRHPLLLDGRAVQPVRHQGGAFHRQGRHPRPRRRPGQRHRPADLGAHRRTHGFTEIVFCLFAVLGLRFSPRIRDLSDQLLYRMGGVGAGDGPRAEAFAKDLLRAKINEKLILRHWDDILRVAGSLKLGWAPASLLVGRLQARPRKSGLAKAIQEYGRLQKTLFILRYAEDLDLRRRIGRQLNKGEELGALKDFLFFANDGNIRKHQPEEQTDQALCLSLLVDAVVLWNTVRYQEALDALRDEGFPVNEEDLAHVSPTRYAHINPYGRYRFDLDEDRVQATGAGPGEAEPRLPGTLF